MNQRRRRSEHLNLTKPVIDPLREQTRPHLAEDDQGFGINLFLITVAVAVVMVGYIAAHLIWGGR